MKKVGTTTIGGEYILDISTQSHPEHKQLKLWETTDGRDLWLMQDVEAWCDANLKERCYIGSRHLLSGIRIYLDFKNPEDMILFKMRWW